MKRLRLILFGGSFDPVHQGHCQVAQFAMKEICADKVCFICARQSPLKTFTPLANNEDRMAMLNLAVSQYENFVACDCELHMPEPSYSIKTIEKFRHDFPSAELFWLVGADSVNELSNWYRIKDIIDTVNIAVMYRSGYPKPLFSPYSDLLGSDRVQKLNTNVIKTPQIDLSSTEIRSRVAQHLPVQNLVGEKVAEYIRKKRLYLTS